MARNVAGEKAGRGSQSLYLADPFLCIAPFAFVMQIGVMHRFFRNLRADLVFLTIALALCAVLTAFVSSSTPNKCTGPIEALFGNCVR